MKPHLVVKPHRASNIWKVEVIGSVDVTRLLGPFGTFVRSVGTATSIRTERFGRTVSTGIGVHLGIRLELPRRGEPGAFPSLESLARTTVVGVNLFGRTSLVGRRRTLGNVLVRYDVDLGRRIV